MTRAAPAAGVDLGADGDSVTLPIVVPRALMTIVAALPDLLSQKNVFAVTGIPPRAYLATLRDAAFDVPIAKIHRLRVVDRAAFVAWVRHRATATRPARSNGSPVLSEGTVAVLEELGFRPAGSASR